MICDSRFPIGDRAGTRCFPQVGPIHGAGNRQSPIANRQFEFAEADAGSGEPDAVDPRVIALLPPQMIQPGEVIILLIKPSPWFIVTECLATLVVIFLLAAIGLALNNRGIPIGLRPTDIVLAAIGLAGVRLFWQFLEWFSRVYVLTDRRIIRVRGVLRISVFECQLKQIQHTTITFSIRERMLGLGTIGFSTAGGAFTEAYWQTIAQPLEVHQTVVQAIERYK